MARPTAGGFTYAPLSGVAFTSGPGADLVGDGRPQLADVARLGRRAVRAIVRTARADLAPSLGGMLQAHLGKEAGQLSVAEETWQPYDHVNVQAGLDAWLSQPGRDHELVGVVNYQHREFGLATLLSGGAMAGPFGPRPGNVATSNLPCGPDGAVRACVTCAIYLVTETRGGRERRTALLFRGADPQMGWGVILQAVSTEPGAAADALRAIRDLAVTHNVFRGQVVSFGREVFERGHSLLRFHRRPELARSDLVLPDGVLEAVERQVIGVRRHRAALLASRQHLKRGVLLYGPPGTGKTHTVRYLLAHTPEVTVVQLTGEALGVISEACSVARTLAPSMVVVEDVDLIAEDRGMRHGPHPLLFQLLNEMDGLAEDADVVFVLTTNRADLLEPALAARPGRVDQAVELGLPDAPARRALLDLYRGELLVDPADLDRAAAATDGVTASFLKELLRRAALVAAEEAPGSAPVPVTRMHLDDALRELQDSRNAMTRALLGSA